MKRKVQLEGELVQGPAAWEVLRAEGQGQQAPDGWGSPCGETV